MFFWRPVRYRVIASTDPKAATPAFASWYLSAPRYPNIRNVCRSRVPKQNNWSLQFFWPFHFPREARVTCMSNLREYTSYTKIKYLVLAPTVAQGTANSRESYLAGTCSTFRLFPVRAQACTTGHWWHFCTWVYSLHTYTVLPPEYITPWEVQILTHFFPVPTYIASHSTSGLP